MTDYRMKVNIDEHKWIYTDCIHVVYSDNPSEDEADGDLTDEEELQRWEQKALALTRELVRYAKAMDVLCNHYDTDVLAWAEGRREGDEEYAVE